MVIIYQEAPKANIDQIILECGQTLLNWKRVKTLWSGNLTWQKVNDIKMCMRSIVLSKYQSDTICAAKNTSQIYNLGQCEIN